MTSAPLSTPLSEDQPTWQQPPGTPARPPLRRSGTDRMAGGVCGGLAEYSGIDSLLWRAACVALTFAGGSGVLVYLLLWVLMPSGPLHPGDQPSLIEQLVGRLHAAVSGARAASPRN
jgi:phage shock protein PspC (stress-responsive transcriptional regulator)